MPTRLHGAWQAESSNPLTNACESEFVLWLVQSPIRVAKNLGDL